MSSNYSANQYESSFRTDRHNNWCERKPFKQRGSAWPDFKGTWDLPSRIPACHINPTGRSVEGLYRLKSWGIDPQHTGTSQSHSCSKKSERLQDVSKQTNRDMQQDCATPSPTAEARPASQNCPVTGGESTTNQNQDSQAAVVGSVVQSDEDKPTGQAPGRERLESQCSAAEDKPASGEETNSGPQTGRGRPVGNVPERAARPETGASSFKKKLHQF
ncbi:protein Flattop isoform X2 [Paralichthys olivaceus]|uniref:protein Flattop isoform X2 n=1 Tax=Paralichthys olivaceus TaxID=8255 RepID=UPI0037526C97